MCSIHSVPSNDPQNDVTTELSGLKSGATYVITVTASNNAEQPESGPSNLITTQTQSELGVYDYLFRKSMLVYTLSCLYRTGWESY